MTFFFLVVGLEAKRELDTGDAARPAPRRAPVRLGDRRHGGAGGDLSRRERGRTGSARLGRGDVDRHGVRPRGPRARRAARHAVAGAAAHARGLRRPDRAAGDRHGLHRATSRSRRCSWPACCSPCSCCCATRRSRGASRPPRGRRGVLGRAVRVWDRSGDRGTGHRARHERLPAAARRARSASSSSRARSASSPPPGSRAARSAGWRRPSRPTSASSTGFTRGRAS